MLAYQVQAQRNSRLTKTKRRTCPHHSFSPSLSREKTLFLRCFCVHDVARCERAASPFSLLLFGRCSLQRCVVPLVSLVSFFLLQQARSSPDFFVVRWLLLPRVLFSLHGVAKLVTVKYLVVFLVLLGPVFLQPTPLQLRYFALILHAETVQPCLLLQP